MTEGKSPSLVIRLLWWFGIYLAGAFPLSLRLGDPSGLFFFPTLLGEFIHARPSPFAVPLGLWLPYIVYLLHFVSTLCVRTRRQVEWMLLILVALVLLTQLMTRNMGDMRTP